MLVKITDPVSCCAKLLFSPRHVHQMYMLVVETGSSDILCCEIDSFAVTLVVVFWICRYDVICTMIGWIGFV